MLTKSSSKALWAHAAHVFVGFLLSPFVIDVFIGMRQSNQALSAIEAVQGALGYLSPFEFAVESLVVTVAKTGPHGAVTGLMLMGVVVCGHVWIVDLPWRCEGR